MIKRKPINPVMEKISDIGTSDAFIGISNYTQLGDFLLITNRRLTLKEMLNLNVNEHEVTPFEDGIWKYVGII